MQLHITLSDTSLQQSGRMVTGNILSPARTFSLQLGLSCSWANTEGASQPCCQPSDSLQPGHLIEMFQIIFHQKLLNQLHESWFSHGIRPPTLQPIALYY